MSNRGRRERCAGIMALQTKPVGNNYFLRAFYKMNDLSQPRFAGGHAVPACVGCIFILLDSLNPLFACDEINSKVHESTIEAWVAEIYSVRFLRVVRKMS